MPTTAAKMVKKHVLEPSSQWLSRLPQTMSQALDAGMDASKRGLKQARHTAEELSDQAAHTAKRYPLQTVAVTFGIAVATGILIGWLAGRKRQPTFFERAGALTRNLFT